MLTSLPRRLAVLGLVLGTAFLGLVPAFAQAPPAVPSLPDTERRTSYSLTASTCSACSVGFALYGDSTDYGAWLEVWLVTGSGTTTASTLLTAVTDYTLSSATGPVATIPRPITDATITLTTARTGTLQIVGARRPRRTSQFAENRGVAARDLNQVLTDIVASNRETWDRTKDVSARALLAMPGDTVGQLPATAVRAGGILGFDSSGNPTIIAAGSSGTANVVGPNVSVVGHIATYGNTSGTLLLDGGLVGAGDVVGPASSVANHAPTFTNTGGKILKDSGLTLTPSTGTITITNAKTLAVDNSLEFAGTDSTVMTFPPTSATIARTDAANTFTGHQTIEGVTSTGATGTGKLVFDTAPTISGAILGGGGGSINGYTIGGTAENVFHASNTSISDHSDITKKLQFDVSGVATGTTRTWIVPNASSTFVGTDNTQTLTNKTITAPTVTGATITTSTYNGLTITATTGGVLTLANNKTLTANNTLTLAGTDATTITFQGTDTYVGRTTTDTLTNKTLTAPVINAGTAAALTNLGIRSTGTGAFDLVLSNTENLTAQRALTLTVNNAPRTISLSGNITTASDFITAGANSLTLTTTAATNITLPTTGTLATQNAVNTFSAINTFSALQQFTDIKFSSGKLYPTSDSTTALQVTKADGTTRIMDFDTTNARVGINKTPGAFDLDVNGTANVGGVLTILTAAPGTNTTQAASTAFVQAAIVSSTTGVASLNGLTGGLSVVQGTGITVSAGGASITVTNSGFVNVYTQSFTSTGTYTPHAGLIKAWVRCVGSGGGGGGVSGSTTGDFGGAGGGAGGYSEVLLTAATIGASKAVTIGAAGTGGATGSNNGTAGSAVSLGSLCVGNGGAGGNYSAAAQAPSAGAGGAAGTGDNVYGGNAGGGGFYNNAASINIIGTGLGFGGASVFGGGGLPGFGTNGGAGTACGAGGAGGYAHQTVSTFAGGDGFKGCVLIIEFASQ